MFYVLIFSQSPVVSPNVERTSEEKIISIQLCHRGHRESGLWKPLKLLKMTKGDMIGCFVTVWPVTVKYWFQNTWNKFNTR